MPKLNIETSEQEKPLLLLVGTKNPLIPELIKIYSLDFKIAHITNSLQKYDNPDIYTIAPSAAKLIRSLEEKIDYAVIFFEDDSIREYIPAVFEKLTTDAAKAAVIIETRSLNNFYDIILTLKNNPRFYFLILGDTYSENPLFNPNSQAYQVVDDALQKKNITINGNDLKSLLCIYWQDAISGINHVLLGPVKREKAYYLFYKHPTTLISAIHIIERVEPDLHVSYNDQGTIDLPADEFQEIERSWKSKIQIEPVFLDKFFDGFERSIAHFIQNNEERKSHLPKASVTFQSLTAQKPKIKFFTFAFLLSLIIFLLINATMVASSAFLFKNSLSSIQKGNFENASSQAKTADVFLKFSSPPAKIIVKGVSMLGFSDVEKKYLQLSEGSELVNIAVDTLQNFDKFIEGFEQKDLEKKISDITYLYFLSSKLLSTTNESNLNIHTSDITNFLSIAQVATDILGYQDEKRYLLLFQNNGELRPTGGFIGSVGEIVINNGKIKAFELQDVYEYDGKLKIHLEPHYIVRRYLQKNLYLRDSNFNPDFQETASMSALLFNLEAGRKVDGVIGLNFEAVRQIIESIGPIKLPAYNTTLDGKNTFEFLQNTIDDNFFPGSTQKKDVLQALFNQLMMAFENRNSAAKIVNIFPRLISEKNILFAFNNISTQSIFNSLNFGGEYKDERVATPRQVLDIIGINEANIGVNKANINVSRSTNYRSDLLTDKIRSTVIHAITNASDKEYKAYIRFYTPAGSRLAQVKIDNSLIKVAPAITDYHEYERKTFKAPVGLEVDEHTIGKFKVFGFIINAKPNSEQVIDVSFDNGIALPNDPSITYSLKVIKQPGTLAYPFTFDLLYGNKFAPKKIETAEIKNGNITMKKSLTTDSEFSAMLIKK